MCTFLCDRIPAWAIALTTLLIFNAGFVAGLLYIAWLKRNENEYECKDDESTHGNAA